MKCLALVLLILVSSMNVVFAADEIIITKSVEERIDLKAMREEIVRIKDYIAYHNSLTRIQKAEIYDKEHQIQGWIDELERKKAELKRLTGE